MYNQCRKAAGLNAGQQRAAVKNPHSLESRALRAVGTEGKEIPKWPIDPTKKLSASQRQRREDATVQTVTEWIFETGVGLAALPGCRYAAFREEYIADSHPQFIQAAITWAIAHPEIAGGVETDRYTDAMQRLSDLAAI